ncbi:DnaD domain protein [Lentilactobacillus sp. Marseille-Q4993]|uniref:DnaD domain-containing protein n=1 Tax=Lentilactobacillus sp. Marseille-Q4993 TaxID=3039492 RepID=UPI0024BC4926|nr:DnaD domain protein [Lentilactobacillus sp. Marseille-Q4993]
MADVDPSKYFAGQTTISNLLLAHYREIGMTNDELILYLLIKQNDDILVPMPDPQVIGSQTGFSEKKIFDLFHSMIEKKLAKISNMNDGNQTIDAYDFSDMYEKLLKLVTEMESTKKAVQATHVDMPSLTDRQRVFSAIEEEFGRTLSGYEIETINDWLGIDNYEPDFILLALKEAVLSQVYNLKYMDRIMLSWNKENLKTAQQVQNKRSKRKQGTDDGNIGKYQGPEIPFIDL